jgi:hypothetical protein
VSADYIPDVFVDKAPGNWLSVELNKFLKYERQISCDNAFVITHRLREKLLNNKQIKARFPSSRPRRVFLRTETITTYVDQEQVISKKRSQSFRSWLEQNGYNYVSVPTDIENGWRIADSIILTTALDIRGYGNVVPSQNDRDFSLDDESGPQISKWKKVSDELHHFPGIKASVQSFIPPVTDDQILRIKYQRIPFSVIKAFHNLLETDKEFYESFRNKAAGDSHRKIPSTLVAHTLVLLRNRQEKVSVLMAHRRNRKESGYYGNCWSVSFEEQFAPVESFWEGKTHSSDNSVVETVARGLREEFLGEEFNGQIEVRICAIQLETRNMNIGVLASAVVQIGIEELIPLWRMAPDSDEHDAVISIPFDEGSLVKCLSSDKLPKNFLVGYEQYYYLIDDEGNRWHPTSKARLAMAMWMLNNMI